MFPLLAVGFGLELWEEPLHCQPPAPGSSSPCFIPQHTEHWEHQFLF